MAPSLLPELLLIVRGDEYGAGLQRRALAILHVVVQVMHTMAGSSREQVGVLRPVMQTCGVCLPALGCHGY